MGGEVEAIHQLKNVLIILFIISWCLRLINMMGIVSEIREIRNRISDAKGDES